MAAPLAVQRRQLRSMGWGALICSGLGPALGVAVMELEPLLTKPQRDPQMVGYQIAFIPLVTFFAYLIFAIPGGIAGVLGGLLLDQFRQRSIVSHFAGGVAGGLLGYFGILVLDWATTFRSQEVLSDMAKSALISGALCGVVLSFFVPSKSRSDRADNWRP